MQQSYLFSNKKRVRDTQKKRDLKRTLLKRRLPLFVLCAVLPLRLGSRRVRHSECHQRHSFTGPMHADLRCIIERREQSHYIQRTPHHKDEGFRKWRLPPLPQNSAVQYHRRCCLSLLPSPLSALCRARAPQARTPPPAPRL